MPGKSQSHNAVPGDSQAWLAGRGEAYDASLSGQRRRHVKISLCVKRKTLWAAETTGAPNHVVEMALAHAVGNAVEAAYRRGDLFDKRRELMTAWATYAGAAS